MKLEEKIISGIALSISIAFLIAASFIIYKYTIPKEAINDVDEAIGYLDSDIKYSISKKRSFFYQVECSPRCLIAEEFLEEKSQLRNSIINAVDMGMKIKVIVPRDVEIEKVKAFMKKCPELEVRIAKRKLISCFRVSGSSVYEETIIPEKNKRRIKRYKYAPRRALARKKEFERIWSESTIITRPE